MARVARNFGSSFNVRLPPASLKASRNKVTVAGVVGTIVFSIARPETDWRGLADTWEETDRANGRPVLERAGERLRTFTLAALFTHERDATPSGEPRDVHTELAALAGLASPLTAERTVAVSYDALTPLMTRSGGWVITDYNFRSLRRRPSDNAIIRAEVDLTFTESSRPVTPSRPGSPSSSSANPVGPPAAPPANAAPPVPSVRRHTVVEGDSLLMLAHTYYGNGAHWKKIADANGIRDPRKLKVGEVLTIP